MTIAQILNAEFIRVEGGSNRGDPWDEDYDAIMAVLDKAKGGE